MTQQTAAPNPETVSGDYDILDRAAGMLAGVAIGDTLGMPAEFLTPDQIREYFGAITSPIAAHPSHPHHRLPIGSVTDDTDHTMLLGQILIDHGEIAPHELAGRLLEWARTPRVKENRFVGPSTLRTLAALQSGTPLFELPRGGTSVGAAMRVAPLAIAFTDRRKLIEQVVASCAISHYTRNAISGAMSMAFALSATLERDADIESISAAAKEGAVMGREFGDWTWTPPIEKRVGYTLEWAQSLPEAEVLARLYELVGVDMYAEQLVPCAIALTCLSDGDPQRAMLLGANLGGDADTLASMTGAICGGWRGLRAVDREWLALVETTNRIDVLETAKKLLVLRQKQQEHEI